VLAGLPSEWDQNKASLVQVGSHGRRSTYVLTLLLSVVTPQGVGKVR
jgi:hypothetical protein